MGATRRGEEKVVWLLGAGFSKPLGGPLLEELFSPRFVAIAQGLLEQQEGQEVARVAAAYRILKRDQLVENAEDFLNVVDTAADGEHPQSEQCRSIIRYLMEQTITFLGREHKFTFPTRHALSSSAKLQIACSCESFVPTEPRGETVPEHWKPYSRWADELIAPQDTIITFNYDRSVEWIRGERRVCTLLPSNEHGLARQEELGRDQPKLLKLHGSVDWSKDRAGATRKPPGDLRKWFKQPLAPESLAIGVPGPGKGSLSTSLFQPLWDRAEDAISNANAVVIVGYRMPDSDGNAMAMLSNALRKAGARFSTRVHLVLGPRTESEDMTRIKGYLRSLVGEKNLHVRPAYAEGFFSTLAGRFTLFPSRGGMSTTV